MGILACPIPCNPEKENSSSHPNHLQTGYHSSSFSSSSSSTSLLNSRRSLSSVPSLSSSSQLLDPLLPSTTHHQCISTLKGHTSYVFSLTFAGKHLFSGSSNDEIRVWTRDPTTHHQYKPHENTNNIVASANGAVKSLVVLGDKLFSAHQDNKIRVWKIDNNNNHHSNEIHQKKIQSVATLPTINDRFLRLFSTKNYVQVRRHKSCTWVHHVDTVTALALNKDGTLLYSVSWDKTIKVWHTSDFRCLESVAKAHDDAINALVVSNDGYVYTGSTDKTIKVWKKKQGQKRHSLVTTLVKHKSGVNALALNQDGSVLYSGACDRSIVVWERDDELGNMVVVGALRGHNKAILCLAVVNDLLFSGSADKTIRVWRKSRVDGKSYSCLAVLEGHVKPVKCLAATVDSDSSNSGNGSWYLVYSGGLDCDIRVWRVWVPFVMS